MKELVDQAEKMQTSALYAAAYELARTDDVDLFGDLEAFHAEAENERVASRSGDTSW